MTVMAESLESSSSVSGRWRVTPEVVRATTHAGSAPPPGPAVHPIVVARSVTLVAIVLALEASGFGELLRAAWAAVLG